MRDENIISILADFVINTVTDEDKFNIKDIIKPFDYSKYGINITPNQSVMLSMHREGLVINFLIEKKIIQKEDKIDLYRLSEFGIEVKTHGSYKSYLEYLEKLKNAPLENLAYNKRIAEATEKSVGFNKITMILIAIYTFLALIVAITSVSTCNYTKRSQSIHKSATNSAADATASMITEIIK